MLAEYKYVVWTSLWREFGIYLFVIPHQLEMIKLFLNLFSTSFFSSNLKKENKSSKEVKTPRTQLKTATEDNSARRGDLQTIFLTE